MAVTDAIQKVARAFECNSVEGILCHQLKRNNYDSEKTIILNPSEQQRSVMAIMDPLSGLGGAFTMASRYS